MKKYASWLSSFIGLTLPLFPLFGEVTYTFKDGDTLYSIARRYDVPVDALLSVNKIPDPTCIEIGTSILIPQTEDQVHKTHYVKVGDTLYGLAREYDVPLKEILDFNSLDAESVLKIGSRIIIPVRDVTATTAVARSGGSHNREDQAASRSKEEPSGYLGGKTEKAEAQRGNGYFWPHPGEIQKLDGKLSHAIAIIGKEGDLVTSISSGIVTWAGPFRGYGKMVLIKSSQGFVYGYGGNGRLFVGVGDRIESGTQIGSLAINAHDGIAKVFFFVTKDGKPYDPSEAPRN